MDYRPFIYGGLASMTAEFGKAEGTLDRRSKRLNWRFNRQVKEMIKNVFGLGADIFCGHSCTLVDVCVEFK